MVSKCHKTICGIMNNFVQLALLAYEVVPHELQNLFKPQHRGTRAKGAAFDVSSSLAIFQQCAV